jgi:uncharacterized protein (DUF1697 family)
VALLRGINVGGRNKIPMADLRAAVGALGYGEVSTYIQSGNVLFSSPEADRSVLEAAIGGAIADTFGLKIGVVVVTRDELCEVLKRNPYPSEPNPKCLHVVFLGAEPDQALRDKLEAATAAATAKGSGRDSVTVIGRTLYLHTPDGFGTSELAKALVRVTTPASGTARNLATTTKLLSLCDGGA